MAAHKKISAEAKQELRRRADEGHTGAQLADWLFAEHGVRVAKQSLNRLVRELREKAGTPKPEPKKAAEPGPIEKKPARRTKAFRTKETVSENVSQSATSFTTGSRARVRPGRGCSVAARVDWCVHLMSTGDWNGYVTRAELSEAWGVKDSVVQSNAAEANRRLRLVDPEELEQSRRSHAAYLRKVRDSAFTLCNQITGLPDFGAAIKATELAAKFEGHDLGVQKVELTGKDGGPIQNVDVTKLSDAELERLAGVSAVASKGAGGAGEA